ncbi:MAG TPA: phosphatase PAP2 family protein [Rudaea sp.]|nr:phosphatase PAP2 family protein [Rudaea sp.]
MSKRALAFTAAIAAALALLSVFAFDQPIAMAVHGSGIENSVFFVDGVVLLDRISGRSLLSSHLLSGLLLGTTLFAAGVIGLLLRRRSFSARALIFTGGVQLAVIATAWVIKHFFGRLRPYEIFSQGHWDSMWFAGGNSFPSGHVAFFCGVFVPLLYLFPRYRIALLIIPVYVVLARIDESFHFVSDVLASAALAALITLIAATILDRWIQPAGSREPL